MVAIPVRNEEACIGACLKALNDQIAGRPDDVVLLLNNCSDRTASIAREFRSRLSYGLHVIDVQLPPGSASAGCARYLALEAAARLAGDTGILLTTDADGRVDPDWIGANLTAIQAGADVVAGWAELDPTDWGSIPLRLHEDDAKEQGYDAACDELHALLDPDPADPLPRHTQASGASITVTVAAYRAAGGMPMVPSGEDRAFIAALRRIDARIRHAPECRVIVSGRTEGRAAGGMADTIRRRLTVPDAYLDDRLEPAEDCARRAALRRMIRTAYEGGAAIDQMHGLLSVEERAMHAALLRPTFGSAWAALERSSPRLRRRRVPTAELPGQQARAEALRSLARHDPVACSEAVLHGMSVG